MPDIVLGTGDTEVNKTEKTLCLCRAAGPTSAGDTDKMQAQWVWNEALGSAFLTDSQEMLILWFSGPHLE